MPDRLGQGSGRCGARAMLSAEAGSADNLMRYSRYAANFASSSQYFLADCLSLRTP
jgi:hypothetical protein